MKQKAIKPSSDNYSIRMLLFKKFNCLLNDMSKYFVNYYLFIVKIDCNY